MLVNVPATEAHALAMAPSLREMDLYDLLITGHEPCRVLLLTLETSLQAPALLWHGVPVGLMGVGVSFDDIGVPWLVGTNWIDENPVAFMREAKAFLNHIWEAFAFRSLFNATCTGNVSSLRFLEHLGFALGESDLMNGVEVTPFGMERP